MDNEKIKSVSNELVGKRIGRLTVREYLYTHKKNGYIFSCVCDCGSVVTRPASQLRRCARINTDCNCGCVKYGCPPKHGETKTRLYIIWDGIKERCRDKKNKNYGARGITICKEWENDFVVFKEWALKNGYSDNLTIDRIDVNGNYEPSNCRWADNHTQANNKRNSVKYLYNGKMYTATELAKLTQITDVALKKRIRKGMSVKEAVETPKNYSYDRYLKTEKQ